MRGELHRLSWMAQGHLSPPRAFIFFSTIHISLSRPQVSLVFSKSHGQNELAMDDVFEDVFRTPSVGFLAMENGEINVDGPKHRFNSLHVFLRFLGK